MKSSSDNSPSSVSVDALLKARRQTLPVSHPSDGFWDNVFAPKLTRKLMAALSRPRHEGRALKIFGWSAPVVFLAALGVALGIAWIFSPQRAIGRWEAQTKGREYVMDTLPSAQRPYAVSRGERALLSAAASDSAPISYVPASSRSSEF